MSDVATSSGFFFLLQHNWVWRSIKVSNVTFLYTVTDVVQVYTKSGSKTAQCTEQLGHFQPFHPVGTPFLAERLK